MVPDINLYNKEWNLNVLETKNIEAKDLANERVGLITGLSIDNLMQGIMKGCELLNVSN